MTTTPRNHHRSLVRLGFGGAVAAVIAITGACTFEIDDDRAAARRLAERVERHADDDGRIEINVDDATACIEFSGGRASFRVEPWTA